MAARKVGLAVLLFAAGVEVANAVIAVAETAAPALTADVVYQVTESGGKFLIDGAISPNLDDLEEGNVYKFELTHDNTLHPFKIGTSQDGGLVTGTTADGTTVTYEGDTAVWFEAGAGLNTYYYYCSAHPGMGGILSVPAPVAVAASIPCDKKFEFELVTPGAGNVTVARMADDDHYWHNLKDIVVNGIDLTIFHFNDLIFLCDFTATPQEFARDQGEWKQKLCSDDSADPWSDGYCSVYTDFSKVANATEKGFISLTIPQLKAQLAAR